MTQFSPQILTALIWITWCFFHSLLISHWWLGYCHALFGDRVVNGLYRVLFNLISLMALLPVVFYQFSVKQVVLFDWPGWWLGLKIVLYVYAFYMFYTGWKRYDLSFFLGLKQLQAFMAHGEQPVSVFTTDKLGVVRHPWYSAGIALVWAFGPITDISLVSKIVISVYFIVGTWLEERKLHQDIGKAYEEYCRKMPMLFPWRRVKK
ncbi:MAG: hypothetical protein KKC76_19180 [Proteobacteria bacterium]|nr:hypothetical protein [Pseudomonadota bacterium]MBU4296279.1 hypothetical protein [Pseudomonadota bacterium]MCG2748627.1 hypothetical protein [Desulfobulbaceae bacterium]